MWSKWLLFLSSAALGCQTDFDCGLNGECIVDEKKCKCDIAWTGESCTELALIPMERAAVERGAYRTGTQTSWGGAPMFSKEDGLYHLIVAEMAHNCTLTSWIPNSQITHAVASRVEGPYTYKETIFSSFHHNPTLRRGPDGMYYLFMIGGTTKDTPDCSSTEGTDEGETFDSRIVVMRARCSMPCVDKSIDQWDYIVTNPAPVFLPNGSVLMYFRGTPKFFALANQTRPRDLPESVGVAFADSWSGPYRKLSKEPILKVMNEDPFAWRDDRGFKMLTHGREDWWNTHYSWSLDGLTWSAGDSIAVTPNITLTDGSVYPFTNRERPQIFFNETTNRPTILFNGVCPGRKYDYAYTLAQFIRQPEESN